MKVEQLMRKYKYGYSHAKYLLEEPFVKDLLQYQQELAMKVYKYKREYRHSLRIIIGKIKLKKYQKKYYEVISKELDDWFERQKKVNKNNFLEKIK